MEQVGRIGAPASELLEAQRRECRGHERRSAKAESQQQKTERFSLVPVAEVEEEEQSDGGGDGEDE